MAETNEEKIAELRQLLEKNPGDDRFVELARLLDGTDESRREAREVCFRGLSRNPRNSLGRLVLAHLFYLDEMFEFSIRELVELRQQSDLPSISRLLDAFGSHAAKFMKQPAAKESPHAPAKAETGAALNAQEAEEGVVAEVDIDSDFLDAINRLQHEK